MCHSIQSPDRDTVGNARPDSFDRRETPRRPWCYPRRVDAGTIVALAHASRSISAFERALLDELMPHVGADVALFQARASGVPAARGFRADIVGDWDASRARHGGELGPVLAAARGGAAVDTQVLGERRVRSARYFSELVRPHGGRETLCAVPIWRGAPVGCLWLGRCGPGGRFRRRDLHAVDHLLPAIALASVSVGEASRRCAAVTLTPREAAIVALLRRGFRSGEIAAQLGTSVNTVRNQIWRLMERLGVGTRAELVAVCAPDDPR
jgi:DNA-binding CsgD family transcriptional regulator